MQLVEGSSPQISTFRIQSIEGSLVSHEALCKEGDRHFAVISIVCGEAFDDGALEDTSLHWACTPRQGGAWEGPPPGWTTEPDSSLDAGKCCDSVAFAGKPCTGCWTLSLCVIDSVRSKHLCTCAVVLACIMHIHISIFPLQIGQHSHHTLQPCYAWFEMDPVVALLDVRKTAESCYCAGGGAYQTLLKRVAAPGYPSRPDIAAHAVTIQVPLEASLSPLALFPPLPLLMLQAQLCTSLCVS